ncbi:hypothetical protein F3D3_1944 [Fusibacter sp. 3D3]|nr:hypothetical protein F3D3_1944 [Fusibacter sp. 3D3]
MEENYGKEFVLETPRRQSNTGFGYVQHVAKGYLKDDPEFKIVITWDENTNEYNDSYLGTKWTKQGKEVMTEKLKAVYGDDFLIDDFKLYFSDKAYKDLNYEDIINKYAYRMSIDLAYSVYLNGDLDRNYEAERVYKILKENFIDIDPTKDLQYFFVVLYIKKGEEESLKELYSNTEEWSGERGPSSLYEKGILEDWIRISYSKGLDVQIQRPPDIEKKFRIFYNITSD